MFLPSSFEKNKKEV